MDAYLCCHCTSCSSQCTLNLSARKLMTGHRVQLDHVILDTSFVQHIFGLHTYSTTHELPPQNVKQSEDIFTSYNYSASKKRYALRVLLSRRAARTIVQYGQYVLLKTVTLCSVVTRSTNARAAAAVSREPAAPIALFACRGFDVRHTKLR